MQCVASKCPFHSDHHPPCAQSLLHSVFLKWLTPLVPHFPSILADLEINIEQAGKERRSEQTQVPHAPTHM